MVDATCSSRKRTRLLVTGAESRSMASHDRTHSSAHAARRVLSSTVGGALRRIVSVALPMGRSHVRSDGAIGGTRPVMADCAQRNALRT